MIKYIYFVMSAIMAIALIEGIPVIDIFSTSWHFIAKWSLAILSFLSLFGTIIILIAYAEEHDNLQSDFVQFFLRTTVGLKFLPKWPVVLWGILAAALVQFNQIGMAVAVTILTIFASAIVFVQNGLYTSFLKGEAKGE